MQDVFETLKGKLVKVVFADGNEIRVLRGDLINFDSETLVLQTLTQPFYISRSRVIKIQPSGSDSYGRG